MGGFLLWARYCLRVVFDDKVEYLGYLALGCAFFRDFKCNRKSWTHSFACRRFLMRLGFRGWVILVAEFALQRAWIGLIWMFVSRFCLIG